MSIDTAERRGAVLGLSTVLPPLPSGTIDEDARSILLRGYWLLFDDEVGEEEPDPEPVVAGIFRPPVVYRQPWVNNRTRGVARSLWRHYGPLPVGRTVLKENGVYVTVDTPTNERILAAQEVYQGGHEYPLTAAQQAALTAAGYGSYIS